MSRLDKIGTHKTSVYTDSDGAIHVKYHKTVVATRMPDGLIVLDSGGWRTATTKVRINQALRSWGTGLYVHQVKGEWYIGEHKGDGIHVRRCEFFDGVGVRAGGLHQ